MSRLPCFDCGQAFALGDLDAQGMCAACVEEAGLCQLCRQPLGPDDLITCVRCNKHDLDPPDRVEAD